MVHFIIDPVDSLHIQSFAINERGSDSPQYPPSMMPALLVYSYSIGRFSSREIEKARHPYHDTICSFRTRNRAAFKEAFVKVLLPAQGGSR